LIAQYCDCHLIAGNNVDETLEDGSEVGNTIEDTKSESDDQ